MTTIRLRLLGLTVLGSVACATSTVRAPAQPKANAGAAVTEAASSGSAANSEPATASRDPEQDFLVHEDSKAIVLHSRSKLPPVTLAPRADAALYDPELELVWLRDGDALSVLDLRRPQPEVVAVARGLPTVNRFSIERGDHLIETEDGCDLPTVDLDWTDEPEIASELAESSGLRIVATNWLQTELGRRTRAPVERREFADQRVRLPRKRLDCEDPSACGSTIAFGHAETDLVLVQEKMGGDCLQRACLIRDRQTDRYGTPPRPGSWSQPQDAASGSCGPYLFDAAGENFLFGRWLCERAGTCIELSGRALGWTHPGPIIGAPGLGNFTAPQ